MDGISLPRYTIEVIETNPDIEWWVRADHSDRDIAKLEAERDELRAQLEAVREWPPKDICGRKTLLFYDSAVYRDRAGCLWSEKPKRWTERIEVSKIVVDRQPDSGKGAERGRGMNDEPREQGKHAFEHALDHLRAAEAERDDLRADLAVRQTAWEYQCMVANDLRAQLEAVRGRLMQDGDGSGAYSELHRDLFNILQPDSLDFLEKSFPPATVCGRKVLGVFSRWVPVEGNPSHEIECGAMDDETWKRQADGDWREEYHRVTILIIEPDETEGS